jgi:hypothetical protein
LKPESLTLFVKRGQTVQHKFVAGSAPPAEYLDVMLVVDTGNMAGMLASDSTFASEMAAVMRDASHFQYLAKPDIRFGLVTFNEKGLSPFGTFLYQG